MRTPWKEDRRELEDRDYELMMIPERYRSASWERVEAPQVSTKALNKYRDKIKSAWEKGVGLYIWGPNGSGKTAIGCLLISDLRAHGQAAFFCRADRLFGSAFKDEKLSDDRPSLWRWVHEVPVLMVDDFGKSYRDEKGFSDIQLEGLLRERYDDKLVTIITSNISPKMLEKSRKEGGWEMKPSTVSIIKSVAVPVAVDSKNHREQEQEGLDGL